MNIPENCRFDNSALIGKKRGIKMKLQNIKRVLRERFFNSKPGKKARAYVMDFKAGKRTAKVGFVLKNKKMKPTDNIGFLIFSLPAVYTCPYATAQCLKYCYAKSAYMYPSVCTNHAGNYVASLQPTFVEDTCKAIETAIYTKKGGIRKAFINPKTGEPKKIYVRIHESGDFYSKAYLLKWVEIAKRFPELQFFAYTKSVPYFYDLELPKNFVVRFSIFPDTPIEYINWIRENNKPFYVAVDEFSSACEYKCNCELGCGGCGCQCGTNKKAIETILKK